MAYYGRLNLLGGAGAGLFAIRIGTFGISWNAKAKVFTGGGGSADPASRIDKRHL